MVLRPQLPKVGGVSLMPNLPSHLAFTQGKIWHVRPDDGSDSNDGKSSRSAFASVAAALSAATANQNDIVLLYSQSNTAADTTSYQSSTAAGGALIWNKDLVHLIGINSGSFVSQRSRIAFLSSHATANNLMSVTANGCYFANIAVFAGVASALPTGCLKVTGSRNVFDNCHIAGIGNDANDIAGAYSLLLDAAQENIFRKCAIGLDTTGAGTAANSEILVDSAASRNLFEDCLIFRMLDHASNHPFVKLADATAIDRWLWFRRCLFGSMSVNYSIKQAGVFKFGAALTQGFIWVEDCKASVGDNSTTAVKWDVDDGNQVTVWNSVIATDTAGTGFMS